MNKIKLLVFLGIVVLSAACGKNYSPDEESYIKEMNEYRMHKDSVMEFTPDSPFNKKGKEHFEPLKYFEVDPEFVFMCKLNLYEKSDTVAIFGTKGDERKAVRYGYFTFKYNNKEYRLNVYESYGKDGSKGYMSWFTDKTTNEESYGVGRYLNINLSPDPEYIYKVDFNLAFNPYCSYSKNYSCAIPTKDDYIDLAITAGEKKFHN